VICPEPSELQQLVRDLHRQASPWLPAGLGSRLHWGPPVLPAAGEARPLTISTARLDRLVEHCSGDFTVTVQAGMPLERLQAELAREKQWLAIDWPWGSGPDGGGSGSVGGLVARGMAGGLRQRYLGVRDQLIGIALLRADGTAARAGGKVVKNVAGYDLMRLFSGSWGSLGLITELTLRTFPQPPHRGGLLIRGDGAALETLRRQALQAPLPPQRLDWWSPALAGDERPALLLSLVSVSPGAITDQLNRHRSAATHLGLEARLLDPDDLLALESEGWGGGRRGDDLWLLQLGVLPARGAALLADPDLHDLTLSLAAGAGQGLAWAAPAALPCHRLERLRRRCEALGGFLTVLQQPRPARLAAWGDAPGRAVIEAIKREFDPLQQLARGRLPGVAAQPPTSA
jgi:glycolate oxidase FAD binding subunit